MTAIIFPSSPTLNQVFSANGTTWIWDGTSWNAFTPAPSVAWTAGTLDSGDASGNNGVAISTSTTAHGIPSPIGNLGAFIKSNGKQWVLGSVPEIPTIIPSGSVFLLYQSAAPIGWTKVTSVNDVALRITSSAGGTVAGTTAFSTVFANQTPTIGATTLSAAQMPSHSHSYTISNNSNTVTASTGSNSANQGLAGSSTGGAGSSGSHTHSMGAITLDIQYANIILCSKD